MKPCPTACRQGWNSGLAVRCRHWLSQRPLLWGSHGECGRDLRVSHLPWVSWAVLSPCFSCPPLGIKGTGWRNRWSWPSSCGQVLLSWLAGTTPESRPQVLGPETHLLALNSAALTVFRIRDFRDAWVHQGREKQSVSWES